MLEKARNAEGQQRSGGARQLASRMAGSGGSRQLLRQEMQWKKKQRSSGASQAVAGTEDGWERRLMR